MIFDEFTDTVMNFYQTLNTLNWVNIRHSKGKNLFCVNPHKKEKVERNKDKN